jgi:hypothetical protein
MEHTINKDRRRFLSAAAMTLAAAPFGAMVAARAQPRSFGALKPQAFAQAVIDVDRF